MEKEEKKKGRPRKVDALKNLKLDEFINNYIIASMNVEEAYFLTFGTRDKNKAKRYAENSYVANAIIQKSTELMLHAEGIDRTWIMKELKYLYDNNRDNRFGQKTALDVLKTMAQMMGVLAPPTTNIQVNNINTEQKLPMLEIKFVTDKSNKELDAADAEIIEGDQYEQQAE